MHQHREKQELTFGQQLNIATNIGDCLSRPLLALFRKPGTAGRKFLNFQALLGLAGQVVIISMGDGPRSDMAAWAGGVTILLYLRHRFARPANPRTTHSGYDGDSVFGRSPAFAKRITEPAFGAFFCWFASFFSPGLSFYLALATAGLVAVQFYANAMVESHMEAMSDQRITADWIRSEHERRNS